MKKRVLSAALSATLALSLGTAAFAVGASNPFADVKEGDWFYDQAMYVYDKGLMQGDGANFNPDDPTNRAMIATILYRIAGQPETEAKENAFSDVEAGSWYESAVRWAQANGVVTGYEDGTFRPDTAITREQFAAMLYRYAQSQGLGFRGAWMFLLNFDDAAEVSEYADEAMHWMTMNGIITGVTEKTLVPGGTATRAQAATMLRRFCDYLAETSATEAPEAKEETVVTDAAGLMEALAEGKTAIAAEQDLTLGEGARVEIPAGTTLRVPGTLTLEAGTELTNKGDVRIAKLVQKAGEKPEEYSEDALYFGSFVNLAYAEIADLVLEHAAWFQERGDGSGELRAVYPGSATLCNGGPEADNADVKLVFTGSVTVPVTCSIYNSRGAELLLADICQAELKDTLRNDGTLTSDGKLTIGLNGRLINGDTGTAVLNGTVDMAEIQTGENPAESTVVNSGSLTVKGTLTVNGVVETGGTMIIAEGGKVLLPATPREALEDRKIHLLFISGGELDIQGNLTAEKDTLVRINGKFIFDGGTVDGDGDFDYQATEGEDGEIHVQENGGFSANIHFNLLVKTQKGFENALKDWNNVRVIELGGPVEIDKDVKLSGALRVSEGGKLTVRDGVTLTVSNRFDCENADSVLLEGGAKLLVVSERPFREDDLARMELTGLKISEPAESEGVYTITVTAK